MFGALLSVHRGQFDPYGAASRNAGCRDRALSKRVLTQDRLRCYNQSMNIQTLIALILQAVMILLTVLSLLITRHHERTEHPERTGSHIFRYFTNDSNAFAAVTAAVSIPFYVKIMAGSTSALPLPLILLYFTASSAVFVTLTTVLFFLGPMMGYKELFSGPALHLHLTGPLLMCVSFVLLLPGKRVAYGYVPLCLLPTLLYGIVYFVMVVVRGSENGGWPDLYNFNQGGRGAISSVAMLAGTFLLGMLLLFLRSLAGS